MLSAVAYTFADQANLDSNTLLGASKSWASVSTIELGCRFNYSRE
jgi:hypothetical protein